VLFGAGHRYSLPALLVGCHLRHPSAARIAPSRKYFEHAPPTNVRGLVLGSSSAWTWTRVVPGPRKAHLASGTAPRQVRGGTVPTAYTRGGTMPTKSVPSVHERLQEVGARALSDAELLTVVLGPTAGANSTCNAAMALLDARPLNEIAWASPEELQQHSGIGAARAAAIVAAFELGRRGAWSPPKRGERVLDPARVYELLRHVAHSEHEEFWVVCLDVRGRLLKTARIAEGSLS